MTKVFHEVDTRQLTEFGSQCQSQCRSPKCRLASSSSRSATTRDGSDFGCSERGGSPSWCGSLGGPGPKSISPSKIAAP